MGDLSGKIAVVTGATRGAGRGIALALGDAGATVYVTGRSTRDGWKPPDGAPGTIEDTAEAVTERGGAGVPVRVDFSIESDVAALFEQVAREHGRVDVLANAVYGGAEAYPSVDDWIASAQEPFWQRAPAHWQHMMTGGPYAYLVASCHAAPLLVEAGGGLIVGVTDGLLGHTPDAVMEGREANEYQGQLLWDLSHDCINRLMFSMAKECRPHGIAVVTLMPGFMQTERVMAAMTSEELKREYRFDLSESTEYLGRAVAALAGDEKVIEKSGRIHFVADLAEEYGFTDIDGRYIPRFRPFD